MFFEQLPNAIKVCRDKDELFSVNATWNEETASCLLFIGETPYEAWQISQKALAPFFFDG